MFLLSYLSITFAVYIQAFAELSVKKIQAESQIRISNAQIDSFNRKIQHAVLVEQEVKSLPGDVKIYKAVGRM